MSSLLLPLQRWPRLASAFLGCVAAAVGSVVVAILLGFFVGYAVHPLESFPWLVATSLVPAAVAGFVLREAVARCQPWSSLFLVTVLCVAFGVVTLAGSIGAPIVQCMRFGPANVNVVGYLKWSPIYGIGLLPITFPLALAVARVMSRDFGIAES